MFFKVFSFKVVLNKVHLIVCCKLVPYSMNPKYTQLFYHGEPTVANLTKKNVLEIYLSWHFLIFIFYFFLLFWPFLIVAT